VLLFGAVGSGKTHLLCGIAQELVRQGRPAYFSKCGLLVQDLLQAKQSLCLPRVLKKLARYEVVVVDDLGYVQQNREEMEVLFTFFAERYERGSVLLTSNLPFSKWEQIFRDPMTTAAAIDRLVHHSVVMELNLPSYRAEQARKGKEKPTGETQPSEAKCRRRCGVLRYAARRFAPTRSAVHPTPTRGGTYRTSPAPRSGRPPAVP